MKRIIKVGLIISIFFFLSSIVYAEETNMYKKVWENDSLYKGVSELFYDEKYTKLHQFQNDFLLEFKYEKDDLYYAIVLFDKDGNVKNYKYMISDDSEYKNKLYYYKDRIYLIDGEDNLIFVYDNNLDKIDGTTEYGGEELSVPIYKVSFYKDSMFIFYKSNGGKNPINYGFYVYEYDLDGNYKESYSYEYKADNNMLFGEEQISTEIYSKQFYFYDKDENKCITFNYDKRDFEFVDYVVNNDENYQSVLSAFCETNYSCDYGKLENFYYVDNHKYNDDVNYIYGNVSVKDDDLVELFKFKNYTSYLEKLIVATNKYFIYTVREKKEDSSSKIYNYTTNKLENMDIENVILSKIFDNYLYTIVYEDNNLKVRKYDLAYNIFVNDINNGSVSVDNYIKYSGDSVLINTSTIDGYVLDTLSIVDQDGNEVKLFNNKFIMPESDVYINASFVKGEENPDTSDFIIRSMFVLLICVCILVYVRKYKCS